MIQAYNKKVPIGSLHGHMKTARSHDIIAAGARHSETPGSRTCIESDNSPEGKTVNPVNHERLMRTAASSQDKYRSSSLIVGPNRSAPAAGAGGQEPRAHRRPERKPNGAGAGGGAGVGAGGGAGGGGGSPHWKVARLTTGSEHLGLHKFSKIPRAKQASAGAAPLVITCTPKESQEYAADSKHEEGIHEKIAKMLMDKENDLIYFDKLLDLPLTSAGVTKCTAQLPTKGKIGDVKRSLEQKKLLYNQMKHELYLRQKQLVEVYTSMKNCSEALSSAGEHDVELPPANDLEVMNLAEIDPQKLLYLCMPPRETDLRAIMDDLCKLPTNLVSICETTLQKRVDIVQWLNSAMKKNKNMNMKELVSKVKDLSSENQHLYDVFSNLKRSFSGEVAELVSLIRNNFNEREELIKKMKSLEIEVSLLNDVNNSLLKQMMNLKNKNNKFTQIAVEELQAELKEVKCKKAALQDKMKFLEIELCVTRNQNATIEASLQETIGEVYSLKEYLKTVQSREQQHITKYEHDIRQLKEITEARSEEINALHNSKRILEEQKDNLLHDMETMKCQYENQVENIKNELNRTKDAEVEKNVAHDTEIENYKTEIEKYVSDIKDKEMKIENLTAVLASHESVSESFNKRQQDLIKVYEKIFTYERQLFSEEDAGSKDNICNKSEGSHCSCHEIDINKLSQASFQNALIDQHNANIAKLKENLQKKDKLCDTLEKLVINLRKQLGLPESDDPFTSEGLQEIFQTVVEKDVKLGKFKTQCHELQCIGDGKKKDEANTLELMQNKMKRINRANFDLTEINKQQELTICRLHEKIKITSDDLSGITKEFNKLYIENRSAQLELLKYEKKIKELERSVETLTTENKTLSNENCTHLKALRLLEENKKSYEETLVNLDGLITDLESELAKTEIADNQSVISSNDDIFSDLILTDDSFDKVKLLDSLKVCNIAQLGYRSDKNKLQKRM